jgi:hypothetical protein
MDTPVWLWWGLSGAALLLGLAAPVRAYAEARRRTWLVHGLLALGVGTALAGLAHAEVYRHLIPWWQTGAGFLAGHSAPVLAAGWAARAAARRSSAAHRWRVGVLALAALVATALAGLRVASVLLPEVVHAVS